MDSRLMDPLWHMYLEFLDPGQQALVFTDNEYKRRQAIYMGCSRELDGAAEGDRAHLVEHVQEAKRQMAERANEVLTAYGAFKDGDHVNVGEL